VLLARLGLRTAEAAALQLEDVDWRCGEILIRGKGNRVERLPLPQAVGEALAHYLAGLRPMPEGMHRLVASSSGLRPAGSRP
jgi:integrase